MMPDRSAAVKARLKSEQAGQIHGCAHTLVHMPELHTVDQVVAGPDIAQDNQIAEQRILPVVAASAALDLKGDSVQDSTHLTG